MFLPPLKRFPIYSLLVSPFFLVTTKKSMVFCESGFHLKQFIQVFFVGNNFSPMRSEPTPVSMGVKTSPSVS